MKLKTFTPILVAVLFLSFLPGIVKAQTCCVVPVQVYSNNYTASTADVHWYYVGPTGCPNPQKFKVQWRALNTAQWSAAMVMFSNIPGYTYTIHNLQSQTGYQWRVRTVCNSGGVMSHSAWTNSQIFTTMRAGALLNATQSLTATVYPNPASSTVTLQTNITDGSTLSYNIVNTLGQVVMSAPSVLSSNGKVNINISSLSSGVYFVQVASGNEQRVIRMEKE